MALFPTGFYVLFALGLLIAAVQLFRFQKQLLQQQIQVKKLSSELNQTAKTAFGFGTRLLTIEQQVKDIKSKHQDMVSFTTDDQYQKRTFKQASQMAQMGASIDQLKQSCELSQGEAELLTHMNLL